MQENHPDYVLFHVERVRAARQDLILEASLAIYMNNDPNVDFLDYYLRTPGKRQDNILLHNLLS